MHFVFILLLSSQGLQTNLEGPNTFAIKFIVILIAPEHSMIRMPSIIHQVKYSLHNFILENLDLSSLLPIHSLNNERSQMYYSRFILILSMILMLNLHWQPRSNRRTH